MIRCIIDKICCGLYEKVKGQETKNAKFLMTLNQSVVLRHIYPWLKRWKWRKWQYLWLWIRQKWFHVKSCWLKMTVFFTLNSSKVISRKILLVENDSFWDSNFGKYFMHFVKVTCPLKSQFDEIFLMTRFLSFFHIVPNVLKQHFFLKISSNQITTIHFSFVTKSVKYSLSRLIFTSNLISRKILSIIPLLYKFPHYVLTISRKIRLPVLHRNLFLLMFYLNFAKSQTFFDCLISRNFCLFQDLSLPLLSKRIDLFYHLSCFSKSWRLWRFYPKSWPAVYFTLYSPK